MADVGHSNPRWVTSTLDRNKRSIRITEDDWEKYKSILCTLYKSYTLNIVMEFMRKRFNFHASKRQYGYRLDKWGVKKYNAGEKKNSMGGLEQMEFDNVRPFNTSLRLSLHSNITSTSAIADEMDHDDPRHRISYSWGPGDSEAIKKLAADFCAAMSDDENAFPLYSDIYNFLSQSNQPHSATQMFIAISCARVADTPENARQAHRLLSSLLNQRQLYDDEPHFVMSMLKAYLEDREQTDNTTVKHLTCATIETFLEANGSLRHLPHNYSSIDMVAYYFLFHSLDQYEHALSEEEIPPNFSTEHLLNDFIRRQPFVDMVRQNPVSQPLRLCVAWCSEQLHNNHPVALQDSLAQSNLKMRHWWDNIRIFCTLWGVLLNLVRAGYAPEWYNQCESAYGISASELLVTVSWMIGAETTPRDYAVSGEDLLRNAAERAQSLSGLKESELLLKFLDKFEWMNELVDLGDDEKSFETFVQSQLRQFLSETLRISLPYPAQSQESAATEPNRFDTFEFNNDFGFVSVNGVDVSVNDVDYSAMASPSAFFGPGSGR